MPTYTWTPSTWKVGDTEYADLDQARAAAAADPDAAAWTVHPSGGVGYGLAPHNARPTRYAHELDDADLGETAATAWPEYSPGAKPDS